MGLPIRKERKIGAAPSIDLRDVGGESLRKIFLDAEVFALEPNIPLMHQVVNAQLAARRQGTQNTKTRAEVRGGGQKPWRQKGTGRARQGSTNAPHFTGGGVALGPKPRDYSQRTPKKMVQQALRSALSDRANEGKVIVIDSFGIDTPNTKGAVAALRALGVEGKTLIVLADEDEAVFLSLRNLDNVHVVHEAELNTFDVLRNDYILFTEQTLPAANAKHGTDASSETEAGDEQ